MTSPSKTSPVKGTLEELFGMQGFTLGNYFKMDAHQRTLQYEWYNSEMFNKITRNLIKYNQQMQRVAYSAEFRIRGFIYTSTEREPLFLVMRKLSARVKGGKFWESTFKGGVIMLQESRLPDGNLTGELRHEVPVDDSELNPIDRTTNYGLSMNASKFHPSATCIDTTTPIERNSDIMIREIAEEDRTIFSFICNYILHSNKSLKLDVNKEGSEHDRYDWVNMQELEKRVKESRDLGMDKDYWFYINTVRYADFNSERCTLRKQ